MDTDPPCAICAGPGEGGCTELHLPHGVHVWLCAHHGGPEFLVRDDGRALGEALVRAWRASGCLTSRRVAALVAYRARLTAVEAPERPRPGSYAWSALRAEAEEAFASGESPGEVIVRLRARAAQGSAQPPSTRTMRRWFREARWAPYAGDRAGTRA